MTDTSSPSPSPRRGRAGRTTAALVAAMAVIVLGFIARQWQSAPEPTGIVEERAGALVFAQPRTLDMVALSDHHSEPFTAEDLHGRWTVLFFGFTSCPDVCPTTLNELDRTSQLLADHPIAERLRFVMITVDPARDTAARMAEYLGKINPGLLGVTGDYLDLQRFAKQFNVSFTKKTDEDDWTLYTVQHSAHVSVLGPQGRYRAFFKQPVNGAALARGLLSLISDAGENATTASATGHASPAAPAR